MGLFTQRQDDENTWAALPGEPRGPRDAAKTLDEAPAVNPLEIGLGAQVTSVVLPMPSAPESDSDASP